MRQTSAAGTIQPPGGARDPRRPPTNEMAPEHRTPTSSRPLVPRCSSTVAALTRTRCSTSSRCPTTTSPSCSSSPTRYACAGAARRSRSRASCRSRPAAAPRTATSARSPASSPRPCGPCGSTSRSWCEAAVETAATGATEFCIVAAVRGPDARLMAQMRDGRGRHPRGRRHQRRRVARHADSGAGRRARRDGRAPLQPQPRDRALVLPERGHDAHLGGALGHADHGPRGRHGGVLRRHRRHGRDAGAAGGVRGAARRARARTRCR